MPKNKYYIGLKLINHKNFPSNLIHLAWEFVYHYKLNNKSV